MQQLNVDPVQMVLMMMVTGASDSKFNGCINFAKCKTPFIFNSVVVHAFFLSLSFSLFIFLVCLLCLS